MNRTEESRTKIESVRKWMAQSGVGGVLLQSRAYFSWITAGGGSHVSTSETKGSAAVLVTPGRAVVVTNNIEARRLADEELPPSCFEVAEYPWHSPAEQDRVISGIAGAGEVGSDQPGNYPLLDADFVELRRVLLPPEVARYRELAQEAAMAVESVCRSAALRDSELEVAGRLAALCCERNILPVVNLVGGDERIAGYRHPLPTHNRIDHRMIVALTAHRGGLHASLSRIVNFEVPGPELTSRQQACARVDGCMILASRLGAGLDEVFKAGMDQYAAEGFPDEWRLHHQGGLTGYAGREIKATESTAYTLQANQAIAWNPTITGAKSEDTILVTEGVPQVLTSTGHWPTIEVDLDGQTVLRPGLLIR